MFHENWYSDQQIRVLQQTLRFVPSSPGFLIEIGCWEGKSTVAIANTCYPEVIHCVDTWYGNIAEQELTGEAHCSVQIAQERDVYTQFLANMGELTKGNFVAYRQDCQEYLETLQQPVKFCHVDGSHDYPSVTRTLQLLLPKLVPGAILCGDDIASAHMNRIDLEGGVERAVEECLPYYLREGNFWYYQHI